MERQPRVPKWLDPFIAVPAPDETGEWKGFCPIHADDNPSASFNIETGVWCCFAGCGGGSLRELKRRVESSMEGEEATIGGFVDPSEVDSNVTNLSKERARRRGGSETEYVSDAAVAGWAQNLLGVNQERLAILLDRRGLTVDTVKRFEVGFDSEKKAFTIPIRDDNGVLLNVRRYRMATGTRRSNYWSVKGMGTRRLFPLSVLREASDILLVEGEFDMMLATQLGFSAITATGGAGSWRPEFGAMFAGKRVTILYDADKPGVVGARKAAMSILPHAESVRMATLPYPVAEDHGPDFTDFIVKDGSSVGDIRSLIEEAKPFGDSKAEEEGPLDVPVSVLDSFNAQLSGSTLQMTATITGKRNPPYQVAKTVHYFCGMDAGQKCGTCPMMSRDGDVTFDIHPSNPVLLNMIDAPDSQQHEVFRKAVGAVKCARAFSEVKAYQNVEELFVRPSVEGDIEDDEGEYTNRKVLSVGRHDTPVNHTMRITGTVLPNPKSQRSEFLAWGMDATESSIDTFRITSELAKELKRFRPSRGQSSLKKAGAIARSLEGAVTEIYGRTSLHVAMDLVWHSVLNFRFNGTPVGKGWLELLVVGDTRTGKSAAAEKLMRHYGLGRMVSCESASFAGIVGGLQQVGAGREWTITWGAIPLNDRRLVVLDEVSGMPVEQIAQMSSIRSSGVAQLTKIATEQTTSRTRLIWMANPRKGRLSDYTYGIHAIPPLIGNQEDIARFDFAMSVAADDVDPHKINRQRTEKPSNQYTAEACHALVQWVWSRKVDDVVWEDGAEAAVYEVAVELGNRYVEDPPLIQAANVRIKVARIAVALAARTFSTDSTYEKVVVTQEHVRSAVEFLDWIYRRKGFGYFDSSAEEIEDRRAAVRSMDDMRRYLKENPEMIKFLRGTPGSFRRQDLEDMLNKSKEEATGIINRLWKMRMVRLKGGEITITPALHQILREVRE